MFVALFFFLERTGSHVVMHSHCVGRIALLFVLCSLPHMHQTAVWLQLVIIADAFFTLKTDLIAVFLWSFSFSTQKMILWKVTGTEMGAEGPVVYSGLQVQAGEAESTAGVGTSVTETNRCRQVGF